MEINVGDTQNIAIKRGKRCELSVHYEHDAPWPLINKSTHLTWDRTVSTGLELVEWKTTKERCTCVTVGRPHSDTTASGRFVREADSPSTDANNLCSGGPD